VVEACAEPKNAADTAALRAPKFSLPGRSQQIVTLDSLDAKVVLVDFWASWCVPCRQSFPWLNALREKYGAKGFVAIAVNVDKDRAAAEKFLAANPASFTIAFDPAGKTAEAFHVSAMPSSYLIARDGTILIRHQGFDPKKTADLETRIAEECSR
jgi:thiol-disulfide isomerase/thioredoxin